MTNAKRWCAATVLCLAGAAGADERAPTIDLVLEQAAEVLVYHADADIGGDERAWLAAHGYAMGADIPGAHGLVMRIFSSTKRGQPGVLVFRGTAPGDAQSFLSDLDPHGIGADQFGANRGLIEESLRQAAARGDGLPIVAGDSLGGALAQLAASAFPSRVGRVVTVHTPGVDRGVATAMHEYNEAHPGHTVEADHYELEGDAVAEAGEALTDGTIHWYRWVGAKETAVLDKHTTWMLTDAARALGVDVPPMNQDRRVVFVRDAPSSSKKSTPLEELRRRAGVVVDGAVAAGQTVDRDGKKVEKDVKHEAGKVESEAKKDAGKAEKDAKSIEKKLGI